MEAATIYIAPDGDDSNDGSLEAPFATLERARAAVRALKREAPRPGGVAVQLRAGAYPMEDSFALTAEDSGTEGAPITYCACEGESVQLVGGRVLEASWFTPVKDPEILDRVISEEARSRLLQVNLREHGITDCGELKRYGYGIRKPEEPPMELFVDGEPMTLARWPNEGAVSMAEVVDVGPTFWPTDEGHGHRSEVFSDGPTEERKAAFWAGGGTFRYDFDRPRLWEKAEDIWLEGVFSEDWAWAYTNIAKIDPEQKTITLRYGDVYGLVKEEWGNDFFHAENLLEEIDVPGEYYLDRKSGLLYLLPPESFGPDSHITVSMLKVPMITLEDVSHVTFRDLVLEGGRGPAATIRGGEGVRIENCEIRLFAGGGIFLDGARHAIVNSDLHHLGATVIALRGGDLDTLVPGRHLVENCHIHDFAYRRKLSSPAVSMRGVGQQVRHCLIHDGTHQGITVGGNDHMIEYNEIHHLPSGTIRDMGAVYFNQGRDPHYRGTVIRRNYFHDSGLDESRGSTCGGVYVDDETCGVVVEQNIFLRLGSKDSDWSVMAHGACHVHTRNNIFVDCATPYMVSFRLNGYAKDMLPGYMERWQEVFDQYDFASMPHGKKYPELLLFLAEDRIAPDTNTLERNLIYNPTRERAIEGGWRIHDGVWAEDETPTYPDVGQRLTVRENLVTESDPGFVDLASDNLSLRPDAPLFQKIPGFVNIPLDEIGLKKGVPVGPRVRR